MEKVRSVVRLTQLILKIMFQLKEKFNGRQIYSCPRMLFEIFNWSLS